MGVTPALSARQVAFSFPGGTSGSAATEVLRCLDLLIRPGETVCLVGPNGCGKSTLLRICAGLVAPDSGDVRVLGGCPGEADVGYLPQAFSESLFPWLTNVDNIAFPLYMNGIPRRAARERAREVGAQVSRTLPLDRYPFELSMGQKQLVALARALVRSPCLLLADEPFSALDFQTRIELQDVFQLTLRPKAGIGALIVTHQVEDAVFMGDRVIVTSRLPMSPIREFEVAADRPRAQAFKRRSEFAALVAEMTDAFLKGLST